MKKEYINPELVIVTLSSLPMLNPASETMDKEGETDEVQGGFFYDNGDEEDW